MLYNHQEYGVDTGSELFFFTPSGLAKSLLFYLHNCGHYICTASYRIERKNYDRFLIFYVNEGSFFLETEGEEYIAHKGDIGIVDCYSQHCYGARENNSVFSWLHFNGANTRDFYDHIIRRHSPVLSHSSAPSAPEKIEELLRLCRMEEEHENHLLSESNISHIIYDILSALLFARQNADGESTRNPYIEQILHYMHDHIADPCTVEELASLANMSRYHFTRVFKNETGYSPHDYLARYRINYAKDLLKSTDLTITEIASATGYEYTTSFTSSFRKIVGISPRDYRKQPI